MEDGRWPTVRPQRRLLVAVHNVTAATRLLDVLPLVADHRIQVSFTVTGSSKFPAGTERFLVESGMQPLDWPAAVEAPKDLVLAASHGGALHRLRAPVMIIPHGMGYNKYLPKDGRNAVFGLAPEWLLDEDGALIPAALVLSHGEQLDRLAAACPQAVPAAVLAGDPCFDRMLASVPLRAVYRRAFDADDRTLVVVSSTWGPDSLYGTDPGFVARLAARLPVDRYRVVLVLHPNITAWHSRWQVDLWLRECRRAGVAVLDPIEGWRAALVAADLVIGDHGSVTYYGAALGRPVALRAAPGQTVDPASAVGGLVRAAPRFDAHADPVAEIARHLAEPAQAEAAGLVSSDPGASAELLRAAVYRLLDLPEPRVPAETPVVPVPATQSDRGLSHVVVVDLDESGSVPVARIDRFPASLVLSGRLPDDAHLVVGTAEPYRRWLELAEIIVLDDPGAAAEATLRSLPGCLLAVAPDGDGWSIVGAGPVLHARGAGGALCASVVRHWLALGRDARALPRRLHLQVADSVRTVEFDG